MRTPIREFAELLRELGGDNVKSLTLFGSIAAGSFDDRRHTARSVLVVEQIDLGLLRRIAEHGPRFGKLRISAPLIMTPQYVRDSLDTFPLEFIEIQQNHMVVFGDEHFSGLEFAERDIRHECERELKVLAMSLRQGLLAAAGQEKALAELELGVGEGLLRIVRGMLWLKGRRDAQSSALVLAEIENLTSRKLPGLRQAISAPEAGGWEGFERLYHDVVALGELVDAW
jgi:hypothetical protein